MQKHRRHQRKVHDRYHAQPHNEELRDGTQPALTGHLHPHHRHGPAAGHWEAVAHRATAINGYRQADREDGREEECSRTRGCGLCGCGPFGWRSCYWRPWANDSRTSKQAGFHIRHEGVSTCFFHYGLWEPGQATGKCSRANPHRASKRNTRGRLFRLPVRTC